MVPVCAVCGAVLEIARTGGGGFTVIVVLALLLPEFGSGWLLVTLALVVNGPDKALTTIVMATFAFTDRFPIVQTTAVVDGLQIPCAVVAETNETLGGNGSVSATALAGEGPLFDTPRV